MSGLLSCSKACQQGYLNPDCSIEERAQFESLSYTATESENGDSAYTYATTIIASPASIYQVQLTTVANGYFTNYVVANVDTTSLTIPNQAPDSNGHYISGYGTLNGNTLTLMYTISYPLHPPFHYVQTNYYSSVWVHQ